MEQRVIQQTFFGNVSRGREAGKGKPPKRHKLTVIPSTGSTLWDSESVSPRLALAPPLVLEIRPEHQLSSEALKLVPGFAYKPLPWPVRIQHTSYGAEVREYAPGYTFFHVDLFSNQQAAKGLTTPNVVSVSGGLGSALAAERVIQRYGRENVLLWFADTRQENPDLYRFLHDLMARWKGVLYYFTEGRTPRQVWDDKRIIPNDLLAPCSFELKVRHFRDFILSMALLPEVYIGYKPGEDKRMCDTISSYSEAIPQATVSYPLVWQPVEIRDLYTVCEQELGIDPPLLYKLGFHYNNCNSDCCRAGMTNRVREAIMFPAQFALSESWETDRRNTGDARQHFTFLKTGSGEEKQIIPLSDVRVRRVPQANELFAREEARRAGRQQRLEARYGA